MRITKIRYQVQLVPFRFTFRHSGAVRKANKTLFIALQTDNGTIGYGECIPRSYLTGETIESCLATLENVLVPRLMDLDFTEDQRPDEVLRPLYETADSQRALAAYGALDIAVFDTWARHFAIPMTRMFSPRDEGFTAALTAPIGLGMPIALTTKFFRKLGFERFKIKIQGQRDAARIAKVRQIVGPKMPILLDANGALESHSAAADLAAFDPYDIALCEEPIAARRFRELVGLEQVSGVPMMADESLCTQGDADALSAAGGIRWWNLRLAKNGGFTGVLTLAHRARERGVQVQLGALVGETSLLTAAAAALLPALRPTYAESSFPHWLLRKDPFISRPQGGASLKPQEGILGLGVIPREDINAWAEIKVP